MAFGRLILTEEGERGREFCLARPHVTIGRGSVNDIALADLKASRCHMRLECSNDGCTIIDLGSVNGTRLNGSPVERAVLQAGDVISVGRSSLRFETAPVEVDAEMTRQDTMLNVEELLEPPLEVNLSDTELPTVVVHAGGRTWEIPLQGDAFTIGRRSDTNIPINSPWVSRVHARIERKRDAFFLEDLDSGNGTWIGNERVSRRQLAPGDMVRIGDAQLVFKAGFAMGELAAVNGPGGQEHERRPIVIVPGFGGSRLFRGSEMIWPKVGRLFLHPETLRYHKDDGVEARGLVDHVVIVPGVIKLDAYGTLVSYLEEVLGYERGKDLLEFGWDFRQDLRISARQLGAAIEAWDVKSPITMIAHSMGALVSRYYVDHLGGRSKVERLVFLGGPLGGTPKALATVMSGPNVLPYGFFGGPMQQVMAEYPSVYQGLPAYRCGTDQHGRPVDWLDDASWLPKPQRPLLASAKDFRAKVRGAPSVPTVCIFGYGMKTVTGVKIERGPDGVCRRMECLSEPGGDSTVPETAAILPGTEIHPVRQYHGSLHTDSDVRMRLKIELTRPEMRVGSARAG